MSNLVEYAKSELRLIGMLGSDDEMNNAMADHIVKMVEVFSDEGHSGFSAAYAVGCLEKLLRFEPLAPLTGNADEWTKVGETMWQNNRCSHVFKDSEDGPAYDAQSVIFREPDGCCYTSRDSSKSVSFPYTPTREYKDVPRGDSKNAV